MGCDSLAGGFFLELLHGFEDLAGHFRIEAVEVGADRAGFIDERELVTVDETAEEVGLGAEVSGDGHEEIADDGAENLLSVTGEEEPAVGFRLEGFRESFQDIGGVGSGVGGEGDQEDIGVGFELGLESGDVVEDGGAFRGATSEEEIGDPDFFRELVAFEGLAVLVDEREVADLLVLAEPGEVGFTCGEETGDEWEDEGLAGGVRCMHELARSYLKVGGNPV
jgi:hypothetical protein